MGNNLCKDRSTHTSDSKSPVDRVIGRCAQICPSTLGKRKHFWDKQVLETSPPHQTQPKMENSGWNNASLTVPDSPKNNTGHPVAPPRKKRPSMLRKDDPPTRNGFKEIFSGQRSDSTTESESQDNGDAKDFSDFEKVPLNRAIEKEKEYLPSEVSRSSEERSEEDRKTVTLTHKVSKVGNKKSDKFFGENLSDCLSDEKVVHSDSDNEDKDDDKTDSKKTDNLTEEKSQFDTDIEYSEEMIRAINKERGALIFALRNATDDDKGEDVPDNAQPVEEPIIVPRRVVRRHICDEDDTLRPHIHHNSLTPDPNAPKKPQRDFTKYKKSLEDPKPEKIVVEASSPKPEVKPEATFARPEAGLRAETAIPTNATDSSSTPALQNEIETIAATESTLKRVSESIPAKMSQSEKVLRRCLSTQSYLTPDLVETIAQQASFSHGYLPEDYISFCNDGSGMAPNSKLEHKRSFSAQPSQVDHKIPSLTQLSAVITTDLENKRPSFSIGSTQLDTSTLNRSGTQTPDNTPTNEPVTPPPVYAKLTAPTPLLPTFESNQKPVESTESRHKSHSVAKSIHQTPSSEDISKAIKSFVEKDDLKPEDVLVLLEEEFGELLHSPSLPSEDRKVIEDLKSIVDTRLEAAMNPFEISKPAIETSEATTVQKSNETKSKIPVREKLGKFNVSEETFHKDFKTTSADNAKLKPAVPLNINKLISEETLINEKRRHSIDEFDHWFAGSPARSRDVPERKRKREASLPGYLKAEEESIEELDIPKTLNADSDEDEKDQDKTNSTDESPALNSKIDTIPEHPNPESPASNDSANRSSDENQNNTTNETIIKNITNNVYAIPAEDKRKSVGHSLLLKFLDIERTNNY